MTGRFRVFTDPDEIAAIESAEAAAKKARAEAELPHRHGATMVSAKMESRMVAAAAFASDMNVDEFEKALRDLDPEVRTMMIEGRFREAEERAKLLEGRFPAVEGDDE